MIGNKQGSTEGRLATVILLDQLARGAFRGSPQAFAGDEVALETARAAYAAGDDAKLTVAERSFLLLPLMHSESLPDQEACLKKANALAADAPDVGQMAYGVNFAQSHMDVISRFGRFPHRNRAKGRQTTDEEAAWLASDACPVWAKSQN